MQAVVYERTGGPEVLAVREQPEPRPRDGAVLVDVAAAGVNYRDVYEREGRPPYTADPPAVIGVEGAGTVVGTGERVAWLDVPGSYASRVAAPRDELVPVPDEVPLDVAAAVMLQGCTAHYLAADSHPVAEDTGVDPQTLVGALVDAWSPAVDDLLAAGTITEDEAEQYRQALADAFTFRVTWDGEEATPTFSGVDA